MCRILALVICISLLLPSLAPASRHQTFWSSPTGRGVVIGGVALGAFLIGNAVANHRAARAAQSDSGGRGSGGGHHYVYTGGESMSDADEEETIREEYARYVKENRTVLQKAKAQLPSKIQAIQGTKPVWVCAAVCGGWKDYELTATPLASDGATEELAEQKLANQCNTTGGIPIDYLVTAQDGLGEISLKESQNVCFANSFSTSMQDEKSGAGPLKVTLFDVEFVETKEGEPISELFKMGAFKMLLDRFKLGNSFSSSFEAFQGLTKNTDVLELMKSLSRESRDPATGIVIYSNKKSNLDRIEFRLQRGKTSVTEDALIPYEYDHKCGAEIRQIKFKLRVDTGPGALKKSGEGLLNLTMDSLNFNPTETKDTYCE